MHVCCIYGIHCCSFCKDDVLAAGVIANINQDVVLYTDADILFYHQFNPCQIDLPEVMAIGPEMDRVANSWSELNWNAGVLVMNLKGFAAVLPDMMQWANSRHWDFKAADQSMLNEYFPAVYGQPLDPLPDIYNWKGYWGCNPAIVRPLICVPCCVQCCFCESVSPSVCPSVQPFFTHSQVKIKLKTCMQPVALFMHMFERGCYCKACFVCLQTGIESAPLDATARVSVLDPNKT